MSPRNTAAVETAVDDAAEQPLTFMAVPLDQVEPSPLNPRKHFDQARLEELAATMANGVGVIEPLVVRRHPTAAFPRYELVAGERRWRAARLAGLAHVPVIVKDLTDPQVLEIMVIENNQRQDVTPLEEADGFSRLMTFGIDLDALAKRIGHPRRYIFDRVRLLELIPPVQELLTAGRITVGHAVVIARLSAAQQERVLEVDQYGGESPLFQAEMSLLTPVEEEAEDAAREKDPYAGMKLRSVRELQAWVDKHCRFVPEATPVNRELYQGTLEQVETAAKVISITRSYIVDPSAKDGDGKRIYTERAWKRADGLEQSKKCNRSVTGVVVVGPGRGEAFPVCVHKECDIHWGAERRAREKAAKSGDTDAYRKRQEAEDRRRQAEEEKARAARELYLKARPQLLDLVVEKMPKLGLGYQVDIIARELRIDLAPAIKALGKAKNAEQALRVFALACVMTTASNEYWGPRSLPKMLKPFGINFDQVLKKASQPAAPQAAARKSTPGAKATGRKKAAKKAR